MKKEFEKTLLKNGVEIFGELHLENEKDILQILNKIEVLNSKNIKIPILNSDIVDILLRLNIEDNLIISKLRTINWCDFEDILKNNSKSKRKEKIYRGFISFLLNELNLNQEDKKFNSFNSSFPIKDQSPELIDGGINNETKLIDLKKGHIGDINLKEILIKKEKFDKEKDLKEKCLKYGVEVLFDYIEPSKKIGVTDFTLYFNRRLQYFTSLISSRVSAENVVRISQLKNLYDTNTSVTIIGLVSEIGKTKNGHYMITIEDKSSQIKCFINKDKTDLVKIVENLCLDEGIGIVGKVGKEIIWTDEIIIPSPPNTNEMKKTEKDNYVVFLSDIHFGAKVFQDEAFQKFLDWINGRTNSEKLNNIAKKVTHVLIAGDIIEGIGIYPGQGKDARILSAEGQYHEAARWLSQIPKDIGIIIIPGNHDTDRLSEPQPKLPYEKAYALYNMENVLILSNPAIIRLFSDDISGGLTYYMYHGGSFFYYGNNIQHLREKGGMKSPEEIVKFLLEKRHLAPSHGATLYIPDTQSDPLVIKKMPDFFVTGHTHKMGIANYKGCTIISGSCWVEMSDYQEKMGMYPDVGKAIIVNTKTRNPQILNFYIEEHKRKEEEKS